ncbi:bifunctional 4-hydroxy-2-oxoglutarate aldolase/2-dehydro-3-deoxy-phosphogluconate aldolase [Desulfotalea psychrophila]|uniref:2-dehydro-3-deoxy-phosphogluconate aldolase n=1 Tax=Desulfotalea psychrophila TaxID=84980 RepID=A0ABS3ATJ4_9BACT|nr:bifunctional 4-hydroxy-2-oxoglutarate aldolase/2-dehydro-3-deoxy-phosphogluconate aldolase [Desulfocapsa sp.]MBN4063900.1 bifunctional 4-hydroxy-2-oxoglutarate aldolase/2-dehydro-3-deoxy-phosphogluconate aldolase [bacterium AH-315-I07]MBN4065031.1 bifunctional 4-hydroxy-2-oxoglutarate aldolase/2-dehydro-3-deoxy-phosphogluconate aldolase [Desulfocapsa sp. AH-315-G09]MBN4068101.1 bifunctional 4-hydroxy-2-oxoglutarate aldolase/2-dehydro-3-deoxy-phosphogluconate aldolase [Desulfotalea psychrophil
MPNTRNWKLTALDILNTGPVVPVIVINTIDHAVPLAKALVAGGVKVLEVTLRSPVAIEAIRRIAEEVPDAVVGAGTVATEADLNAVTAAGGIFAISPGLTPTLLKAAISGSIAFIPGISTASELMLGMEYGLREFKFFPAEAAGGIKMIKSIGGPFPQATFCPTGGISPNNYKDYLSLKNVACVGGSWLVPTDALEQGDFQRITTLARKATL